MTDNGKTHGDLKANEQSYERFLGWLKFGLIGSIVIVALVVFLLTR